MYKANRFFTIIIILFISVAIMGSCGGGGGESSRGGDGGGSGGGTDNTTQYFPAIYSTYKVKTQAKSTITIGGNTSTVSSTIYQWVNGEENISGVNCKKVYTSDNDFYQTYKSSNDIAYGISYVAFLNGEMRTYAGDTEMKSGSVSRTYFVPYSIAYISNMQLGKQYIHHYEVSYGSTILYTIDTIIEMIGYEDVATSFGTFLNCLKWKMINIIDGYSQPAVIIWNAKGLGTVKSVTKGTDFETTVEQLSTFY